MYRISEEASTQKYKYKSTKNEIQIIIDVFICHYNQSINKLIKLLFLHL